MRLLQMGRAGLFSLAIAPLIGTSVSFGDSQWTILIGVAILLVGTGIFVRMQTVRSRRSYVNLEPKTGTEKVSNNLVALSSAAILAVYGAGYFRTNSAAHVFAQQTVEMKMAVAVAAGNLPSTAPAKLIANPASSTGASAQANGIASSKLSSDPAAGKDLTAHSSSRPAVASHTTKKDAEGENGQAGDTQAAAAAPAPPPSPYKDGTYTGWGTCPHGNIQASVVIASGLIVAADVSQCETRYPCSMLDKLTNEVVYQQSPNVDVVTGATESAYAFHVAVTQALAAAMSQAK